MGKRTQGSRRLDHVDRQSQVGVSGAMRARDVSRPTDDEHTAAEADYSDHTDAETPPHESA